jgi:hypothetical protein
MWHDYSGGYGRGQGRSKVGLALICLLPVALLLAAGCGTTSQPAASPSSLDKAFRSAHPEGSRPEAVATVPASLAQLRQQLTDAAAGAPVLLPAELPAGWGVAAPYIAVGSGAALPNPELWDPGYRLTLTDGHALLIVQAGAERVPGSGSWAPTSLSVAGRPLTWRCDGDRVVLASPAAADWRLVIIADGLKEARVEELLRAMLESPA